MIEKIDKSKDEKDKIFGKTDQKKKKEKDRNNTKKIKGDIATDVRKK